MALNRLSGFIVGLLLSVSVFAADVELNPTHPDRYVVVKGDTLWDISAKFLTTPWRWPDIWYVNPQIANPHLIYPGDIIELSYVDGQPRLTLQRGRDRKLSPEIRVSDLEDAIPTIPIDAIAPFMGNPRVVSKEEYDSAPYVVAFKDSHILGSAGVNAYVRSIEQGDPNGYVVIRMGDAYHDAETGELLGYEAVQIAETELLRAGDPATFRLPKTNREVEKGDRMMPVMEAQLRQNFYPHAPESDLSGHIISVLEGVTQIGQFNVVVIDRGEHDGVEVGHVLTVDQAGPEIRDVVAGRGEMVTLPNEEAGVMMVFRVFDRVSYGLIMEASSVMHKGDIVRTP